MAKLTHVQTIMEVEKLDKLKQRSGEHQTKDAVLAAVDHYLECSQTRFKKS